MEEGEEMEEGEDRVGGGETEKMLYIEETQSDKKYQET